MTFFFDAPPTHGAHFFRPLVDDPAVFRSGPLLLRFVFPTAGAAMVRVLEACAAAYEQGADVGRLCGTIQEAAVCLGYEADVTVQLAEVARAGRRVLMARIHINMKAGATASAASADTVRGC